MNIDELKVIKEILEEEKNILEMPYPNLIITDETIRNIKNHPQLYIESPVRTHIGKLYTTEEFKQRSDKILSKKLPGQEKRFTLFKKRIK